MSTTKPDYYIAGRYIVTPGFYDLLAMIPTPCRPVYFGEVGTNNPLWQGPDMKIYPRPIQFLILPYYATFLQERQKN